jgi:hypothetical protein
MTDLLDLLRSIADDPTVIGELARDRIIDAMLKASDNHEGALDPNQVRALLSNDHGLTVNPRQLSATYSSLRQKGTIVPTGWTVNQDVHGGNAGKPLRTYTWVGRR